MRPTFFNAAFPQVIVPAAPPGDRVSITGVHEDGPLVFHLPTPRCACACVRRRDRRAHPAIDQIGVEPDLVRVFCPTAIRFATS